MNKLSFHWAVVGAGPAGIAAIGKLLDEGVKSADIVWLDPYFQVGDLGRLWCHVSSNTKVTRFTDFLNASSAFAYETIAREFKLHCLPPTETCLLRHVVEPLQWITQQFSQRIYCMPTMVRQLTLSARQWVIHTTSQTVTARQVILAPGAFPSELNYPTVKVLPFETAIDKTRLAASIDLTHNYAVVGSSHSAFIIVRHLVELGVKKIINFYRSPCRYALDMGDWILFDNTGLKGQTAQWVREHIDGTLPANLVRYPVNETTLASYLPLCQQIIYAVGFKKRNTIGITGYDQVSYNPQTGIIAPGLFGLGIAYPEIKADPMGIVESQVGLWKFMVYLKKILPIWLKYST